MPEDGGQRPEAGRRIAEGARSGLDGTVGTAQALRGGPIFLFGWQPNKEDENKIQEGQVRARWSLGPALKKRQFRVSSSGFAANTEFLVPGFKFHVKREG